MTIWELESKLIDVISDAAYRVLRFLIMRPEAELKHISSHQINLKCRNLNQIAVESIKN